MRVEKVNQRDKIGVIKFNNESEIDLVEESMNLLIQKQQMLADKYPDDSDEIQKLEKFKKTKDRAIEMPKQMRKREKEQREKIKEKFKKEKEQKIKAGIKPEDLKEEDYSDTDEYKRIQRMRTEGEGQALTGDVEISEKNVHDIVNALNNHIYELEKDGTFNWNKYERLKDLLHDAQEQKDLFHRIPQKPRGFGRLRK